MSILENAVDLVYYSYMKAQKYQSYDSLDSEKRNPIFSKEIIQKYNSSNTTNTTNILITGSKGKGSVASILSTLLSSNYKVGLTTSPHISSFNDRFKINNKIMTEQDFIRISNSIKTEIYEIDSKLEKNECISPMGVQAVIALKYFNENNTNINIFECGKGVKYDDINNVSHTIAILNTVFLEHTRELGGTIFEILQDKLSIVTDETKYLYVGNIVKQSIEYVNYIKEYVANSYPNCKVKFYGEDYSCDNIVIDKLGTSFSAVINDTIYNLKIPLYGQHQADNTTLALALYFDIISKIECISDIHIDLNKILDQITVVGRLQILKKSPFLIVDTCINRESCKEVVIVLKKIYPNKKLNFIICIPDDKDYIGVVELISPLAKNIILTKTKNNYYKFSDIQKKNLDKYDNIKLFDNIIQLDDINQAIEFSENEDCCILCTTGLLPEII